MEFVTLEDIKREFRFDVEDITDIISRLRAKLKVLHPDANGGDFASETQKAEFMKIQAAFQCATELLRKDSVLVLYDPKNELERVQQEKAVIELQQQTLALEQKKREQQQQRRGALQDKLQAEIKSVLEEKQRIFRIPSISLTAVSTLFSALWFLPTSQSSDMVLLQYIRTDSLWFALTWLFLIMGTITLWILGWQQSRRERRNLSQLKVESVQNEIFENFLQEVEDKGYADISWRKIKKFERNDLVRYIREGITRGQLGPLRSLRIDDLWSVPLKLDSQECRDRWGVGC
jgi:hypothetical protein